MSFKDILFKIKIIYDAIHQFNKDYPGVGSVIKQYVNEVPNSSSLFPKVSFPSFTPFKTKFKLKFNSSELGGLEIEVLKQINPKNNLPIINRVYHIPKGEKKKLLYDRAKNP